jgi:hypothetical protein
MGKSAQATAKPLFAGSIPARASQRGIADDVENGHGPSNFPAATIDSARSVASTFLIDGRVERAHAANGPLVPPLHPEPLSTVRENAPGSSLRARASEYSEELVDRCAIALGQRLNAFVNGARQSQSDCAHNFLFPIAPVSRGWSGVRTRTPNCSVRVPRTRPSHM